MGKALKAVFTLNVKIDPLIWHLKQLSHKDLSHKALSHKALSHNALSHNDLHLKRALSGRGKRHFSKNKI